MYTEILKNTPCVYYISDGIGHVKIGVASDLYSRFATIQVGNASELTLMNVEYFDDISEAYIREEELHGYLANNVVRGEWFDEQSVADFLNGIKKDIETSYRYSNNFGVALKVWMAQAEFFSQNPKAKDQLNPPEYYLYKHGLTPQDDENYGWVEENGERIPIYISFCNFIGSGKNRKKKNGAIHA